MTFFAEPVPITGAINSSAFASTSASVIGLVVVPRTAISFAPYGNAVFVVQDGEQKNEDGEVQKVVKKRFVKLGRRRGDLVAVVEGLKAGEVVATSGLLKLRNDATVTIENDVEPSAEATPTPDNS